MQITASFKDAREMVLPGRLANIIRGMGDGGKGGDGDGSVSIQIRAFDVESVKRLLKANVICAYVDS